MIVIDTNVLSETLRTLPEKRVVRWMAAQERPTLCTTTITQAEMLYGIEVLPAGKRRTSLADVADRIFAEEFFGRILPFSEEAALLYPKIMAGRKSLGRPISRLDAMIAAIARSIHAAVATRNTRDFEHCGISIVNPWTD